MNKELYEQIRQLDIKIRLVEALEDLVKACEDNVKVDDYIYELIAEVRGR